jgi:hypothetical protein
MDLLAAYLRRKTDAGERHADCSFPTAVTAPAFVTFLLAKGASQVRFNAETLTLMSGNGPSPELLPPIHKIPQERY